jgi:hypothetical protein
MVRRNMPVVRPAKVDSDMTARMGGATFPVPTCWPTMENVLFSEKVSFETTYLMLTIATLRFFNPLRL